MTAVVRETTIAGADALVLENDSLAITMVPGVGGKLTSLVDRRAGREWLVQSESGRPRAAGLDAPYGADAASGWDECFPSVAAGVYPLSPAPGAPLADHGEVWSRPWDVRRVDEGVELEITGARFGYRLRRALRLDSARLVATYTLENTSGHPLSAAWSMHALCRLEHGMQLLLDQPCSVDCDFAQPATIAQERERLAWPQTPPGDARALADVVGTPDPSALKLFTQRGAVARLVLFDVDVHAWLGVDVDPSTAPFVGLWLNRGGWCGLHHVDLEPTPSPFDDLARAVACGAIRPLAAAATRAWAVTVEVGGESEPASFLGGTAAAPLEVWPR